RLEKMQKQLRQAPVVPVAVHHPEFRAAIHRAIKTKRAWIKRQSSDTALTTKQRRDLDTDLRDLDHLETTLFGVQHRRASLFVEYGSKPPTGEHIIHNAVIRRCLEAGKPHLIPRRRLINTRARGMTKSVSLCMQLKS